MFAPYISHIRCIHILCARPKLKLGHQDGPARALASISSSVCIPNDVLNDNAESNDTPIVNESLKPRPRISENSRRFVPAVPSLGLANAANSTCVDIPCGSLSASFSTQCCVRQGTFLNCRVAPLNEARKLPVGSDVILNFNPELLVLIQPC